MGERLVTRDDAALVLIRLVAAEKDMGARVNACFGTVGDVLLRRYAAALLDVGPVIVVVQGVCVSLSLERAENWGVDQVLARLEQLEDDLGFLVPLIEKQNAETA